jgi:hypothetical protein
MFHTLDVEATLTALNAYCANMEERGEHEEKNGDNDESH